MGRIKPQALLQQSKKKKSTYQISINTIIGYAFVLILILFFLYFTYTRWSRERSGLGVPVFEDDETSVDSLKTKFQYAILSTTKGSISVELFKDSSPEIVRKFIRLSQKGHFKGMRFHRVIKHYVIQAGDVDKLGAVEEWTLSRKHDGQLDSLEHEDFMLGTSKAKDSGFELFITTAPIPHLNEKLTVFGRVVKGQDVVQEIEELDTDEHYRPKSNIDIGDVSLKEKI